MSNNPLKPLDDGQVEDIAGGYLFNAGHLVTGPWKLNTPYEVIDDKGDVVERFKSVSAAEKYAEENGYDTNWLSPSQLQALRDTGNPWNGSPWD